MTTGPDKLVRRKVRLRAYSQEDLLEGINREIVPVLQEILDRYNVHEHDEEGGTGVVGRDGAVGPPGLDGDDGELVMFGIPGPAGAAGSAGATGAAGATGPPGLDGSDGEDGLPGPPGVAGAAGATGATGATGPQGPPGADGAEGPEGPMGPPGPTGPAGAAGSLTLTTTEVDLGSTPRMAGKFTITTAGLTSGKAVFIQQANGPYTNKGTLTDEAEMDGLTVSGKTTSTTTIECFWHSATYVKGNFKFDYAVSA